MADSDFDITGRVRIDTTELSDLSSSIGGSFKKMAAAAAGALAAVGVADILRDSIQEARESVRVTALTENAIKSTGGAAKITADQVGDLATSLSNYAGIDDEVIQGGENLLLTFKGVRNEMGKGNDIFNQTSKLAVDMATVFGTDVNSAFLSLGKALDAPEKGLAKLGKQGVTFTEQQKEQVKTLVASGKTLEAQKVILDELATQVGGAAGAAADPWQRFQVVIGNLKEAIGTQLLPIFNDVIAFLADKIPVAVEFVRGAISTLVLGFKEFDVAGQFEGTEGALFRIGQTARQVFEVVKDVIGVVASLIKGDLAGAGVDIGKLLGLEEDSKGTDAIIKTLEAVRNGISQMIDFVVANGPKVVSFFQTQVLPVLAQVGTFIANNLVPIMAGIGAALAASGIVAIIGTISSLVATLGPVILALVSPVGLAVLAIGALVAGVVYAYQHFETFRNIVNDVLSFVTEQFTNLVAFGQEIFPQLQEAISHVFHAIQDVIGAVLAVVTTLWRVFGDDLMTYVDGIFQVIKSVIGIAVNNIANTIRLVLAVINGDWGKAWQALKDIVSGTLDGIKGILSGMLGIIKGIVGGWYDGIKSAGSAAFKALSDAVGDIDLYKIGQNMLQGFIDGIKSMASKVIQSIKDTITDALPGYVKDALGIKSPSRVFADIGKQVPAGMVQGILGGASAVTGAMNDMLDIGALRFGSDSSLAGRMAAGGINIEVNFNGPVADGDSVRGAIPELTDALRAAVGGA